MPNLRPEVQEFAEKMELILRKNDHKDGWSTCEIKHLFSRLLDEVFELQREIDKYNRSSIVRECCDVANFAMMIASNVIRDNPPLIKISDFDMKTATDAIIRGDQ